MEFWAILDGEWSKSESNCVVEECNQDGQPIRREHEQASSLCNDVGVSGGEDDSHRSINSEGQQCKYTTPSQNF